MVFLYTKFHLVIAFSLLVSWFAGAVLAIPLRHGGTQHMPILELPYGSFRATYNHKSDLYIFKNIPYAAPPVGDLRWRKPQPPHKIAGIQDGKHGPICPQGSLGGFNVVGPGNRYPIGKAINQLFAGLPVPNFGLASEDCLYLDLFVPGKAIMDGEKLPVAVFVFGGAFVMGSKDIYEPWLPFYDGSGLINRSKNNMIFISFNYRLGTFGWLAGRSMENEGLPNAGLWDQRAVFKWVQDYIHLVNGDPQSVTAIGESAGASSLQHHLVANGGNLDPLFHRLILMSPAFQPMWDRDGSLEDTYQRFLTLAGCQGRGVQCLRKSSTDVLQKANSALMREHTPGSFAVGPAPDGSFIRQLPVLELASGHYWPLQSMLLSHTSAESVLFVSGAVRTNQDFRDFMPALFPQYAIDEGLVEMVVDFYPEVTKHDSFFRTQSARMEMFVRDACFTCNLRYLLDAYGDKRTWLMQYSVTPGWHGADLFAFFYNTKLTNTSWSLLLASIVAFPVGLVFKGISRIIQTYYASYIITGDPNSQRSHWGVPRGLRWEHQVSRTNDEIGNVLNAGNFGFSKVKDDQLPYSACNFWRELFATATVMGGYAPDGESMNFWNSSGSVGDINLLNNVAHNVTSKYPGAVGKWINETAVAQGRWVNHTTVAHGLVVDGTGTVFDGGQWRNISL